MSGITMWLEYDEEYGKYQTHESVDGKYHYAASAALGHLLIIPDTVEMYFAKERGLHRFPKLDLYAVLFCTSLLTDCRPSATGDFSTNAWGTILATEALDRHKEQRPKWMLSTRAVGAELDLRIDETLTDIMEWRHDRYAKLRDWNRPYPHMTKYERTNRFDLCDKCQCGIFGDGIDLCPDLSSRLRGSQI